MQGPLIAPSVMAMDWARMAEELSSCHEAGADLLHLDVMDGHYNANLTFGPDVARAIGRLSRLPLWVHLMVEEPARWVKGFAFRGVELMTGHVEAKAPSLFLMEAKALGLRVGLALEPQTPIEALSPYLPHLDLVLVMAVPTGRSGQRFRPEALEKLSELRRLRERGGFSYKLAVDGGINEDTVGPVRDAGAELLALGSWFFGSPPGERARVVGLARGLQRA